MKSPLPLLASVAVAGTAAFFVGRATAPSAAPDDVDAHPGQAAEGSANAGRFADGSGGLADSARLSERQESDDGSVSWDVLTEEMERIIKTGDPLAKVQAWLDFVNTLDRDQFAAVVASFREKGFPRENLAEYEMLMTAWAKIDPLGALDYATENIDHPFARDTILATWAASDPQGAIAWARTNHEGDGANPLMVGVIRGLAASDPTLASQLMTEMPYSRERGEALAAVLPQMLEQGADVAKSWISSLEDERLRDGAVRRLADQLMRTDPADAAHWLAANPGQESGRGIDDAVTAWADQDKEGALAFYESLPSGDMRSNALRGLTNQMATENPREAAQFLDRNSADADDRVYQQFVWHAFRGDPEVAVNYIGHIQDGRQQSRMYRRMLDGWMQRDFNSATAWMTSNDLPPNVVDHMNQRIRDYQENRE
ncbi:hypothetical protein [Haloferula sargassicola]|uniref:HEAT repeat domain-containing protein n=1 Tax=Haloferula sargassicola TaxID=490096 RepID=A0ABP9UW34_9BACT